MTHFYERNIVEIKNIYTIFLTNIITPLIYEGIKSVYNNASNIEHKFIEKGNIDPNVQNPGVLKIFQICLKDIPTLNQHEIEKETNRIKEKSKCSEWFDQLVKAVIKSHIVLLTYNASGKTCKLVKEKHHEMINVTDFIHKCYIECARVFYNYPELFYHQYTTLEIKRNQREAQELIKTAISEAIKKMLPIKLILQEYLSNDYIKDVEENIGENMSENQYLNMNQMVARDLADVNDDRVVNVFADAKHSSIIDTTDNIDFEEENKIFEEELNAATKNMKDDNVIENENNMIDDNIKEKENDISDNDKNSITSINNENNDKHSITSTNTNNNDDTNNNNDDKNDIVYLDYPKAIRTKKGDFFKDKVIPINNVSKIENKNKSISPTSDSDDFNINVDRSLKGSDVKTLFNDYNK